MVVTLEEIKQIEVAFDIEYAKYKDIKIAYLQGYNAGAAAEREACANLVDECVNVELLADAIRARGRE